MTWLLSSLSDESKLEDYFFHGKAADKEFGLLLAALSHAYCHSPVAASYDAGLEVTLRGRPVGGVGGAPAVDVGVGPLGAVSEACGPAKGVLVAAGLAGSGGDSGEHTAAAASSARRWLM